MVWDAKPRGDRGTHVEVLKGAKADFPGQDDVTPSQRAKVLQLVVRVSSYQSMQGGCWGQCKTRGQSLGDRRWFTVMLGGSGT